MSYTPPASTALPFTWVGEPAYTAPDGGALLYTWATGPDPVAGTGEGTVDVIGAGTGFHAQLYTGAGAGAVDILGTGTARLVFSAEGDGTVALFGDAVGFVGEVAQGAGDGMVDVFGSGAGGAGVQGAGAGAIGIAGAAVGGAGAQGAGAGTVDFFGAGVAMHPRYELRGVVKVGEVLVNRRVRAYLRSSGALVGEVDTVAGAFAIPAGLVEAEHYVIPIDLADEAVDWLPPTANRVLSKIAMDA